VLRPRTSAEVAAVVRIASRQGTPLYPISTGRNWGYGCAAPASPGCAIVDLREMTEIVVVDEELGLVTVQPGVTQGMLAGFLERRGLDFLVPVTGAGPDASILGNALERGYGLAPCGDHFAAITSLQAILPDGSTYRGALDGLGCDGLEHNFKWGIGPYLDGMFTQSNLGIVTQVTLALARRPERVEAFLFRIDRDGSLEEAVGAVRSILRRCGSTVGGINLMNARRVLAMVARYPHEQVADGEVMSQDQVEALARKHRLGAWLGVGALYGTARMVAAARREIRDVLRPLKMRARFFTARKIKAARTLVNLVPGLRNGALAGRLERLDALLANLDGRPSTIALRLAYWRCRRPPVGPGMDPTRDGCGLLWYAPLVPMRSESVRAYVDNVVERCSEFGVEPLITLTSLSDRCFDSTVPLLFDKEDAERTRCAHACLKSLLESGRVRGFMPYRLGLGSMVHVSGTQSPFMDLAVRIKRALDPRGIISPGRYIPEPRG
jgi:4-cresol dehydrogenase (hydroxylating) flavoprotein subunit